VLLLLFNCIEQIAPSSNLKNNFKNNHRKNSYLFRFIHFLFFNLISKRTKYSIHHFLLFLSFYTSSVDSSVVNPLNSLSLVNKLVITHLSKSSYQRLEQSIDLRIASLALSLFLSIYQEKSNLKEPQQSTF